MYFDWLYASLCRTVVPADILCVGPLCLYDFGRLVRWCLQHDSRLSFTGDLTPAQQVVAAVAGDRVSQTTSESAAPAELVLLRAVSSYETAMSWLEKLHESTTTRCVVIRNTGWPHGRRDEYPAGSDRGLPGGTFPLDPGLRMQSGFNNKARHAADEGGHANGVRTAVEDFVIAHRDWSCSFFPGMHGAAVLVRNDTDKIVSDSLPTLSPAVRQWLELIERDRVSRMYPSP